MRNGKITASSREPAATMVLPGVVAAGSGPAAICKAPSVSGTPSGTSGCELSGSTSASAFSSSSSRKPPGAALSTVCTISSPADFCWDVSTMSMSMFFLSSPFRSLPGSLSYLFSVSCRRRAPRAFCLLTVGKPASMPGRILVSM